jgi:tetratricopeptide (TPR) repeat protein
MKDETKVFIKKRMWPLLVSAGSASVMLLAFFIPSIQDQWDRYESRNIIQQYVAIGDDFMKEENYPMAVEAFTKAFELSEEKRLDIEIKRLNAKVNLIYQNPVWSSKPPEGLEEVDFQFLLHLKKGPEHVVERASILTSYGIYLAAVGKHREAESVIRKAIRLNPKETLAYINLGNLMDETGQKDKAEKAYRQAIRLAPGNARAHYNLGLLHLEKNNLAEAEKEFNKAIALDPLDKDATNQRDIIRKALNK